jgi:regulator of replication initiation timing
MDPELIENYNKQYLSEGGSWNRDTCLDNNNKIETYSGPGSLLKNTENLIGKVDAIEKVQKETAEEIKALRVEYNTLDKRVLVIETENKTNSKQENAIIGTLNYIKNSIDTNKNK